MLHVHERMGFMLIDMLEDRMCTVNGTQCRAVDRKIVDEVLVDLLVLLQCMSERSVFSLAFPCFEDVCRTVQADEVGA